MVSLPVSDELSISDFYYNPAEGFLIVTVQVNIFFLIYAEKNQNF